LIAAEVSEGATVPTDAQYEAAKKKAEDLLAQWKKDGGTEAAFIEMVKKESADTGSAENGGLYEKVTTTQSYVTEFSNWAVDPSRKPGDTGLVKNAYSETKGYHIMYYVGQNEPLWKMDARNTMKQNATNEWVNALVEAANVTRGSGLKYVG